MKTTAAMSPSHDGIGDPHEITVTKTAPGSAIARVPAPPALENRTNLQPDEDERETA